MLSVLLQRKYNFYHQNMIFDAFRTNSRNIIGKNLSMVIPLLANQALTPMLILITSCYSKNSSTPNMNAFGLFPPGICCKFSS